MVKVKSVNNIAVPYSCPKLYMELMARKRKIIAAYCARTLHLCFTCTVAAHQQVPQIQEDLIGHAGGMPCKLLKTPFRPGTHSAQSSHAIFPTMSTLQAMLLAILGSM